MAVRIAHNGDGRHANRATQREMLDRMSATHRRIVATVLEHQLETSPQQIAALFDDESYLEELLSCLSGYARGLLARAAFRDGGLALRLHPYDLNPYSKWERQRTRAVRELEAHGLVFPFINRWDIVYHVPVNLHSLLRRVIATRYVRSARRATAQRWLATQRQDLDDMATLWILLALTPAPTKPNGEIYTNSKRRMHASLSAVDIDDPDGTLTSRRLRLALTQLRDSGHLQLRTDGRYRHPPKGELAAAGDLGRALTSGVAFEHFPYDHAHRDVANIVCARALAETLTGQDVGILSFEKCMQRLLMAFEIWIPDEQHIPGEMALVGLLPGWLRGELQLGLSRGKLVAVRFARAQQPSDERATRRTIAERCDAVHPITPANAVPCTFSRWSPSEPYSLYMRPFHGENLADRTLVSTLDTPLNEELFAPFMDEWERITLVG
jgi:hypothetical protein